MTIESERIAYLRRLKADTKLCIKDHAKKMRIPYQTLLCILRGKSLGTIKTWQRIEKYYLRQDKVK